MGKERLTITVDSDLLQQLDRVIDKKKIRNRSHAVETLLRESLLPRVTRAVILAGGTGALLKPLTLELPKALVPVGGRPLLEHTLERLRDAGFRDVIISIGRLGDKIRQTFGDGERFDMRIRYIEQDENERGTAPPLRQLRGTVGSGPFLLQYGDVLCDIDYLDLLEAHIRNRGQATVALTTVREPASWGVVALKGNRVTAFSEKPKENQASHLIYAGIGVLEGELLDEIPSAIESLEGELFPRLADKGVLFGYPFGASWFDVGTPEEYERAVSYWS